MTFLLITHALSNSFQEIPHVITSTHTQFYVFKPIVWVFLLEQIQKDAWVMTSNEWELYVAAKLLTNSKHLKGVNTFLLILDKKQAYL